MPEEHDLERSLDPIWQCLSQDKRPIAFLIGAGCPSAVKIPGVDGAESPLIPDVAGLTAGLVRELGVDDETSSLLTKLIETLDADLPREPNLEDMLTWLRTATTIVGSDVIRGFSGSDIDRLETAITERIASAVDVSLPESGDSPFDALAVWVGATGRAHAVSIFTTNYDLLLEQAFERNAVPFFDGFVGSRRPFLDIHALEVDDVPSRWARVWKLHGSVNWSLLEDGSVVRSLPASPEGQRLIHPSHLKYEESRRMPYLVMQDRFRSFFREASATLVTIGYSYGDQHINELVIEGLRANPSAAVFAMLYKALDSYAEAKTLAASSPNLALFASDHGCLATRTGRWSAVPAEGEPATCQVGDFREFGRRLRRLVGTREPEPGVDGAE